MSLRKQAIVPVIAEELIGLLSYHAPLGQPRPFGTPQNFTAFRGPSLLVLMKPPSFALGVIFGNRDFFPDKLVAEARADLVKLLAETGIDAVILGPAQTKLGGVETHDDARACAELFRRNRDRIGGVLVVLPNFGDEKGVA